MTTALLLSGGVDSALALHLLCEQGVYPDLFYIKIGDKDNKELTCTAEEDIELCRATARRYALPLEVVDLQKEYWEYVVGYVTEHARRGLTPNPDVMCNKFIKFGCFFDMIGHRYDVVATGHYANVLTDAEGLKWLGTALDPVKDQTDFLAQITYEQLSRLTFPVGPLLKEEVRRRALEARLPSALRKDSQGICFLGQVNYPSFLRRLLGEREGDVIDRESGKSVGKHKGYWFYTIGQRKGLGLGGGPWYVTGKDVEKNIIYVAHGYDCEEQYRSTFILRDFHFISGDLWEGAPEADVSIKIRHTPEFVRAHLTRRRDGFQIVSEKPLQGVAPGQFGVLYDASHTRCVGSGEISANN